MNKRRFGGRGQGGQKWFCLEMHPANRLLQKESLRSCLGQIPLEGLVLGRKNPRTSLFQSIDGSLGQGVKGVQLQKSMAKASGNERLPSRFPLPFFHRFWFLLGFFRGFPFQVE